MEKIYNAVDFREEKYEDLLKYIDSYVLGCECCGMDMKYEVDETFGVYVIEVKHKSYKSSIEDDVATSFRICIVNDSFYEANISIRGLCSFNSSKVSRDLTKNNFQWRKKKRGIYHQYIIKFFEQDKIKDFLNIMTPYLP